MVQCMSSYTGFLFQKSWENSSRPANSMFMTLGNPTWGWSLLERWMAANTIQVKGTAFMELNNYQSPAKSSIRKNDMQGGTSKSFTRYQVNSDKLSSLRESEKQSQTTSPRSPFTTTRPPTSALARKMKFPSTRNRISAVDDDSNSMMSMQSEQCRRHSIGGAYICDDESPWSSQPIPSYMVPTESARAKSRRPSPSGAENKGTAEKEKGNAASRKKQLTLPPSSAKQRLNLVTPKAKITENTVLEVEVVD